MYEITDPHAKPHMCVTVCVCICTPSVYVCASVLVHISVCQLVHMSV